LHLGLYVLILAMIASGWLMVSASPLPIPIHLPLGFTLPNLTGPNVHIEARAKFTHGVLSKLVIGVIALHVTGALKHHFIDHDGVLSRMLPCGAGIARAIVARLSAWGQFQNWQDNCQVRFAATSVQCNTGVLSR
jgi:Prokaryotic cytochrome b561